MSTSSLIDAVIAPTTDVESSGAGRRGQRPPCGMSHTCSPPPERSRLSPCRAGSNVTPGWECVVVVGGGWGGGLLELLSE